MNIDKTWNGKEQEKHVELLKTVGPRGPRWQRRNGAGNVSSLHHAQGFVRT